MYTPNKSSLRSHAWRNQKCVRHSGSASRILRISGRASASRIRGTGRRWRSWLVSHQRLPRRRLLMPLRSRVRQDRNRDPRRRRSHYVLTRSHAGEPALHLFWTLRQMNILKPDVLEATPMCHDPIIEGDARITASQLTHFKTDTSFSGYIQTAAVAVGSDRDVVVGGVHDTEHTVTAAALCLAVDADVIAGGSDCVAVHAVSASARILPIHPIGVTGSRSGAATHAGATGADNRSSDTGCSAGGGVVDSNHASAAGAGTLAVHTVGISRCGVGIAGHTRAVDGGTVSPHAQRGALATDSNPVRATPVHACTVGARTLPVHATGVAGSRGGVTAHPASAGAGALAVDAVGIAGSSVCHAYHARPVAIGITRDARPRFRIGLAGHPSCMAAFPGVAGEPIHGRV